MVQQIGTLFTGLLYMHSNKMCMHTVQMCLYWCGMHVSLT